MKTKFYNSSRRKHLYKTIILAMIILLTYTEVNAVNKTWTGSTSSDWSTGSNWGGTAPASTDDVLIPGGLSRYPVINNTVTVKTITINNTGSSASLSVTTSGSLTVSGTITVNANGTFNMLNGIASLNGIKSSGSVNIEGGTITSVVDITVSSGTFTQSGGTVWMAANISTNPTANLIITGGTITQSGGTFYVMDYSPNAGTFNQNGSTAVFRIFHDWKPTSIHTFNSTNGTVRYSGAPNSGNFKSTNAQFNNIIVDAGINPQFSQAAASLVKISGNFTNNNTGLDVGVKATFIFNGSGAQSITGVSSGNSFGHMTVNKSGGTLSLANAISIAGDFSMTAGTIDPGNYLLTINGTFLSFAGGSIIVGASTFAGNFSKNPPASAGTTINYSASGPQTVTHLYNYTNLTISGSGTKTLTGNINAGGVLTVKAGSTLDLSSYSLGATTSPTSLVLENGSVSGSKITGSGTITLGGNLTVNNTATGNDGAIISAPIALGANRTITIADDGTSATDLTLSGIISGASFGLTKAGAGTMVLSGDNTYTGLTNINEGKLKLGAAGGSTNTPLGTTGGATTVVTGAALDLNGFTLGTAESLTINGTGISSGGALLNSSATAVNYNGNISLGSASSIYTTGNITLGSDISGSQDLTKAGNGTLSFANGTATLANLTISAGTLTSTSATMYLAGDFSNNGTFSHNNGAVNFNGSVTQSIKSGGSTFYNVSFNNTSGGNSNINITDAMTISKSGTFNDGILNYNGGSLTFTNGADCPDGGSAYSFVNGAVIKIGSNEFIFPVGKISGVNEIWAPVRIASPGTILDQFTCEYFFSTSPNNSDPSDMCDVVQLNHTSGVEYWNLNRDNGTSTPDVTLFWKEAGRSGIVFLSDIVVARRGSCWESLGGTASGTTGVNGTGSVTGTGFMNYGIITFGTKNNNNPLPITLLSFDAKCNNNTIDLFWSTATETNNDYFTIERSTDAVNWEFVSIVKGSGNSNSMLSYSAKDNLIVGISYYRLKQTDFDGKSETFSPIAVNCASSLEQSSVSYFPNPFRSEIVVDIKNVSSENASITFYDIFGTKILTKNISQDQMESKTFSLNLGELTKGLYTIEFRSDSYSKSEKIVKN